LGLVALACRSYSSLVSLVCWDKFSPHADALTKARQEKARREAQQFSGIILPLRKQGATLRNICEVLNASGMKTIRGRSFNPSLVSRMLSKLEVA